ncbi:coiled-coil domain-containing protein 78 [Erinaceus europaeus]|uniref:Coiled-coil domain-containing protein 78 n=1 Tax=Erinaceus europaeus TaxID=9365 RepID=A0ABM3VWH3_ERIEU|nr:coiled-coil domain-containing protein 78 [Erinaceus europaeus]
MGGVRESQDQQKPWQPSHPVTATEVLPPAKDWLPAASREAPAWASPAETELSEEQQLQISKELVNLQITTHQLQGQHEVEIFELKSEVLRLESRVLELEQQREQDALAKAKSGMPAQELVRMAWSQGRSGHRQHQAQSPDVLSAEEQEPGSSVHAPPQARGGNRTRGTEPGSQPVLSSTPQAEVSRALEQLGARQLALEMHVTALDRQLQGAQADARTAGQRLATQAAALSTCQGQLRQAEAENSRLQLQLKKLNEEYALRLQRCARDMAELVDGAVPAPTAAVRPFLEAALEDMRVAHRSREQQLARAARTYRKRLAELSSRHEELLAAHGVQHMLVDANGAAGTLKATEDAALWGQEPTALHPATGPSQQQEAQKKNKEAPQAGMPESQSHLEAASSWDQLNQKLQDFSRGAQVELERERAQLLVRAAKAEEQLSELQEYVDQHLGRYKQEVQRLRKLVDLSKVRAAPPTQPPRTHSH